MSDSSRCASARADGLASFRCTHEKTSIVRIASTKAAKRCVSSLELAPMYVARTGSSMPPGPSGRVGSSHRTRTIHGWLPYRMESISSEPSMKTAAHGAFSSCWRTSRSLR